MIIFQKFIYREDMQANPNIFYLFGDNEKRYGNGGQAHQMRGEPNAIGIRTKKAPLYDDWVYWSDEDYDRQVALVNEDMQKVWDRVKFGHHIIIPLDGLGTGMSQLNTRAPKTLLYIEKWIKNLQYMSKW